MQSGTVTASEQDQVLLHAAEMSVLGGGMLMPEALDEVEFLQPEHFRSEINGTIFDALRFLRSKGKPTDANVLAECLQKRKQLADIGGPAYLAEILEAVPHAAHTKYYADIVHDRWQRREIEYAAAASARAAANLSASPAEIAGEAETRLHKIIESETRGDAKAVDGIMLNLWESLQAPTVRGEPTGFTAIDEKVTGLKPGSLTIVGARPSIGKTAFAGNMALNFATRGVPVLFFSMEQPAVELAERWLACYATVSLHNLRRVGELDEIDREMIVAKSNVLSGLPLTIDDTPGRTVSQIEATSRLMKRRNGIGLVVVDYLQLIEPEDRRAPREQQVSAASRRLKCLARMLEIPIICLSQLSRATEATEAKRPALAHLRESGAIEQDADTVMLLHRPSFYAAMQSDGGDDDGERRRGKGFQLGQDDPSYAELIIAKNRSGQTGVAKLTWCGDRMTFMDRAEDIPEYGQFDN